MRFNAKAEVSKHIGSPRTQRGYDNQYQEQILYYDQY